MYSYGLGGGQPTKHNLLWQDRRDRNVPTQPQQNDNWWNKVKRSVSATEPPQLIPSKVFFRDKGMLGGKGVLNVPERKQEPQLFSLNNVEEGPTRPQLNLGDIKSHFNPPSSQQTIQIQPPDSPLESTPESTPTHPSDSEETSQFLIPSVQSVEPTQPIKQSPDLVTASETEIIKPPSPFMDLSRRRPPPVPTEIPRPRPRMMEQSYEGQERRNIVKETVSLFEKKSPVMLRRKNSPEDIGITVKIPNKAVNARQRSRGPSRTPSEPDLSRQVTPTNTETRDINDRLSKSYEFQERTETSFSRDASFSDATSLGSRLDATQPQVKERKTSVLRGFIKATRSKISLGDANQLEKGKSNTEPSRRKLRRSSSSINQVKSEVQITNKSTDSVETNSNRSKFGKKRKPSHLELQQGFNVRGFDNFMMY